MTPSCKNFFGLLLGAGLSLAPGARADTTVRITGIGTHVDDGFAIDTHVDSVTYSDPAIVEVQGFGEAFEIRGSVSGVGWGGGGIVARATNAHYAYDIPFVARWRRHGASRDLVMHFHGGSFPVIAAVTRDKLLGPQNPSRWAELGGDFTAGLPALLNHCTYISTNRRGLGGDGTFSATYLPDAVPPLSQAEADALNATIAGAPGDPGFRQPGIEAGAPVPLLPTNDAPTFRDIARALQQVVGDVSGTRFRARIATGLSSGARLSGSFNFGRTVIGSQSVRTGGNNVVPYDPGSARIFDGFILSGFGYDTAAARADAVHSISAPVFFIQGRGDERYQQPIRMANELLEKGIPLNGSLWIYEVKGLTHLTRDLVYETVQPSNGDAIGPFQSAAIRNMSELLREGREPPVSRIAGRIQAGALVIDQAGGVSTTIQPILEDPRIDTMQVDAQLTQRVIGAAETARWQAVTAVLEHESDAIIPPTIACRVGGYKLKFTAAELLPFSPQALASAYGNFNGYRQCVSDVVAGLEAERLYDSRVESAHAAAEPARGLFAR